MPIYENKKNAHSRVIKLFGKVVLVTTSGYKKRTQRFFGNLISTQKISDDDDNETKITKILNYVISKREVKNGFKRTYFLGKLISSTDLNAKFIKKYQKYIEGYKHIIVLHANSGEVYLFLTYVLDTFLKKNRIEDNFIIIATKKYHMDLINLLCPEIPHCYVKTMEILRKNHTDINGYNFYTVFTGQHFIQVESDIKNSPLDTAHYFYSIINEFDIKKEELGFRQVKISDDLKNKTIEKAKKIGLNLEKFVFIAPEAYSCEEYGNDFWVDLCNKLQDEGYNVFFNIVDEDTDIVGCSYKTCDLSFSEAFALSKMSKGIVSLRSGLTECLLQTNVPLLTLYTDFRYRKTFGDMDVKHVLSGFGLKKIPNTNYDKIFEYNMSEIKGADVITDIIEEINKEAGNESLQKN